MSGTSQRTFLSLIFLIIEKAKDGRITLEEVAEIIREVSPEHFTDVYDEVVKAEEDGHISWSEAVSIALAVIK